MEKSTMLGENRTGIGKSPAHGKAMISGAEEYTSTKDTNSHDMSVIDKLYIRESGRIGSTPMPDTLRGALKAGIDKVTGRNPEVLLNKLGERLAFERTGVRLYESVMTKCEAADDAHPSGPVTVTALGEIRDEEEEHFRLLHEAMESIGADPTAQTPDADVSSVAAMGIQQVLNDPRTTMPQCLEMLLTLELTDNAAWELLIKLAEDLGMEDLTARFQRARAQEDEHLRRVKAWYEAMTLSEAGVEQQAGL